MRKNVVRGFKMWEDAQTVPGATSAEVNVLNLDKASIYLSWQGVGYNTVFGEIKVQAKNSDNGEWFDLDMGGPILLEEDQGSHLLLFAELPHNTIRLLFDAEMPSPHTITAVLTAKQVGG